MTVALCTHAHQRIERPGPTDRARSWCMDCGAELKAYWSYELPGKGMVAICRKCGVKKPRTIEYFTTGPRCALVNLCKECKEERHGDYSRHSG